MKYTVQIKYKDFIEVFDVDILKGRVNIELKNILPSVRSSFQTHYILDLSNIRSGYKVFPLDVGDILIIQDRNNIIFEYCSADQVYWCNVSASQIISYISQHNVLNEILPYVNDDQDLFLNALLSDFIRNDYSYSDYNKHIKYAKVGILSGFIRNFLDFDIKRLIWDESVLGDVEIEDIALALHFSERQFVYTTKVDNLAKILVLLEHENIIQEKFTFKNNNLVINTSDYNKRFNIIFRNASNNVQYDIPPVSNYMFELGESNYEMYFKGGSISKMVTGNVYIYNGDIQDWFIK
ncbi:MAG: hypothetical protein KatS3mg084_0251 [Candidatus Dojkabacteria bacterium]|nr:MAG: hypothetical protein KatS3mg084_0251 [Candidatus Dojkabacteria bacterium]